MTRPVVWEGHAGEQSLALQVKLHLARGHLLAKRLGQATALHTDISNSDL